MSVKEEIINKSKIAICGMYDRTLFRDERNAATYFSLRVSGNVTEGITKFGTVVVSAFVPDYKKGTPLYVEGEWVKADKGLRLKASVVKEETWDEASASEYLASGLCTGIGYAMARKIIDRFGTKVFDIMTKPGAAEQLSKEISGLSYEKAVMLCSAVEDTVSQRELFDFVIRYGGYYPMALKLYRDFGMNAKDELCKSPYRVGLKYGFSFEQCDRIARDRKMDMRSKDRLSAAAETCLYRSSAAGNTFMYQQALCDNTKRLLGQSDIYAQDIPAAMIMAAVLNDRDMCVEEDFLDRVYYKRMRFAEKNVAAQIRRLQQTSQALNYTEDLVSYAEGLCNISYAPQQRDAFKLLKQTGLAIVTGGPGTGKTTTINGIISAYVKMYPQNTVKLCAPTGRAAQRMTESTGREATTIHRLLNYRPFGNDIIHKNAEDPIEADFIVVDESSMLDIELASIFLTAVKPGSLVLLVGDINQLPSIGAGDVLHDLIQSEVVPVQPLTTVYRQSQESPIIVNANRINSGNDDLIAKPDFQIKYVDQVKEVPGKVISAIKQFYNPEKPFETQVLAPTHKGDAGVAGLNNILQKLLNPSKGEKELKYGGRTYRKGDKIITLNNNYSMGYFNGDLGIVKEVRDAEMTIEIGDKEIVIDRELMEDVNLAYVMTIHKSQGSEFPNVIISLPFNPASMLKRNLLYTAVTRAKKNVVIVAENGAVAQAISSCDTGKRNSRLVERMKGED